MVRTSFLNDDYHYGLAYGSSHKAGSWTEYRTFHSPSENGLSRPCGSYGGGSLPHKDLRTHIIQVPFGRSCLGYDRDDESDDPGLKGG